MWGQLLSHSHSEYLYGEQSLNIIRVLSFWKKGNTIEASKALKDAEKCCEKTSDQTLLKDIYRELTILNCEIGASDLALQYAHKQLSAARKDGDNRRRKIKRALQTENSLLSETNKKLSESETELGKENSTMRKRVDLLSKSLADSKERIGNNHKDREQQPASLRLERHERLHVCGNVLHVEASEFN